MDETPGPDPAAYRPGGWSVFWSVVLILDLLLLASNVILSLFLFDADSSVTFTKRMLYVEVLTTFFLVGVLPFLWVRATRQGGLQGTLRYLGLEPEKLRDGLAAGSLWGIGLVGMAIGFLALMDLLFGTPEESGLVQGLLAVLDWPLALTVALAAGIGEEILYRGVLQRWIGVWGQGIVFGLSHAAYGTVANIVAPFAIGILLGFLFQRRRNLYLVIMAHFLYDFILLGISLLVGA